MNSQELVVSFNEDCRFSVTYDGEAVTDITFENPQQDKDRRRIGWYLEVYATQSLDEPDDQEAASIEKRIKSLGKELYAALFNDWRSGRLFDRFHDDNTGARWLTIESTNPAILSLPWELMRLPGRAQLFLENPRISLRRRMPGIDEGYRGHRSESRATLRMLMLVSRPEGTGFIDPRADPQAVLDAIDRYAPCRIEVEFLRPVTREALADRLRNTDLPEINILHFDGHGAFQDLDEQTVEGDPRFGRNVVSEIQRQRSAKGSPQDAPVGVGLLAFEQDDGSAHYLSASDIATELLGAKIDLVVLSACQSATLAKEYDEHQDSKQQARASVAGSLITAGLPSVIAMSHSVLVASTRSLFGKFYGSLARGNGIGQALDDARHQLIIDREKYSAVRAGREHTLFLQDWFVPCLYQRYPDNPLLNKSADQQVPSALDIPLRQSTAFYGRQEELWKIERVFSATGIQTCRRFSITGFGGQGKTALAREAGRWLQRNGMFDRVVFVSFAQYQGGNAVEQAVATIGTALGQSLIDGEAVRDVFVATPTLMILDNLESLSDQGRMELLDVAVSWSEAGRSRVLLTSRQPDFQHASYPIRGNYGHQHLVLNGLGQRDAIDYYLALSALPGESAQVPVPTRDQLVNLLGKLNFHPLSIAILAQQLKSRDAIDLLDGLDRLLEDPDLIDASSEDTPIGLAASIELSIQQLSLDQQKNIERLCIFESGAFEDDLLAISDFAGSTTLNPDEVLKRIRFLESDCDDPHLILRASNPDPIFAEQTVDFTDQQIEDLRSRCFRNSEADRLRNELRKKSDWDVLLQLLVRSGLASTERVSDVPVKYIKFHPTLPILLRRKIADHEDFQQLQERHAKRYLQDIGYRYVSDDHSPENSRKIVSLGLPNMIKAAEYFISHQKKECVGMVDKLSRFLVAFGRHKTAIEFSEKINNYPAQSDSFEWFVSRYLYADLMWKENPDGALGEFNKILDQVPDDLFDRRARAYYGVSRCFRRKGDPLGSIKYLKLAESLFVGKELEEDEVKLLGNVCTDLGDSFIDTGEVDLAEDQYKKAIYLKRQVGELRGVLIAKSQFGKVFMARGLYRDSVNYHSSLLTDSDYDKIDEPYGKAVLHLRIGISMLHIAQSNGDENSLERAESSLRDASALFESTGSVVDVCSSWLSLSNVFMAKGDRDVAERWLRKALSRLGKPKKGSTSITVDVMLSLSKLLAGKEGGSIESKDLAMNSLVILGDSTHQSMKVRSVHMYLANMADRHNDGKLSREHLHSARAIELNSPIKSSSYMHMFRGLIYDVVRLVKSRKDPSLLENKLVDFEKDCPLNKRIAFAVRKILSGQRNFEKLTSHMGVEVIVIQCILENIGGARE